MEVSKSSQADKRSTAQPGQKEKKNLQVPQFDDSKLSCCGTTALFSQMRIKNKQTTKKKNPQYLSFYTVLKKAFENITSYCVQAQQLTTSFSKNRNIRCKREVL